MAYCTADVPPVVINNTPEPFTPQYGELVKLFFAFILFHLLLIIYDIDCTPDDPPVVDNRRNRFRPRAPRGQQKGDPCAICFEAKLRALVRLECGHIFHSEF